MRVALISATKKPINTMAEAASNCYNSPPSEGAVHHCIKSGHHSILEFADFHFRVEEVSRALTHQLVRHRLASFAQRSQRYVREDGFEYVTPKSLRGIEVEILIDGKTIPFNYDRAMDLINDLYTQFTNSGVPEEDARYILPNACHSVIDVKMNFRELVHFCNVRMCMRAQWEIRQLAYKMRDILADQPNTGQLVKYLVPKCETHQIPYCSEGSKSCGKYPSFFEATMKFANQQGGIA